MIHVITNVKMGTDCNKALPTLISFFAPVNLDVYEVMRLPAPFLQDTVLMEYTTTFPYLGLAGGARAKPCIWVPGAAGSLDVGSDALLAEVTSDVDVLRRPFRMFVLIHDHVQLCSLIPQAQAV